MRILNFDLNFLGVVEICVANIHDFFQNFLECLNLIYSSLYHDSIYGLVSLDIFPDGPM